MRLSDKEKKAIRENIWRHDPAAVILLFGSRTNDSEKGGDIDILVESLILDFNAKLEAGIGLKILIPL